MQTNPESLCSFIKNNDCIEFINKGVLKNSSGSSKFDEARMPNKWSWEILGTIFRELLWKPRDLEQVIHNLAKENTCVLK